MKLEEVQVYLNNLTPTYQHNYNTRSSSSKRNFVPRVGSHAKDSFVYAAINKWVKLPTEVKESSSKAMFKSKCKKFLLDKMKCDNENDFLFY